MKKSLFLFAVAALMLMVASCVKPIPTPDPNNNGNKPDVPELFDITVQLAYNTVDFEMAGVAIDLADEAGLASYQAMTDASGAVSFKVPAGTYTASANYKTADDGKRISFNGSNTSIKVSSIGHSRFYINLNKVESQQIIIKELYSTGCPNSAQGANVQYFHDAYIILYNNSDLEADASDIVFTIAAPYNSYGNQVAKYYVMDELLYEHADWVPSISAIVWFSSQVTIPPYSQIVIAIFGAIDHTQTVKEAVDLSDASYYAMAPSLVPQWTHNKYSAPSENIPTSHYLGGIQFTQGNAWAISNNSPGFYIGKMPKEQAQALGEDAASFDHTLGSSAAFNVVKFPKANIVDAVDVWSAPNLSTSKARFPSDINTGYVALTNGLGYGVYRNVDKEATEALAENTGKLVYGYTGGTEDVEGSTDPSGIDAEASIAAGAHIIYSDTNNTAKDFHVRKLRSLKK